MASARLVALKEILDMLDECAPGARVVPKEHRNWVLYSGLTYRGLPQGAHGKKNPEIQIGQVKRLARHLGILDCAKRFFQFN
jgi:hypothetical protein